MFTFHNETKISQNITTSQDMKTVLFTSTRPMYFVFCRLYPFSPQPSRQCMVLHFISLLYSPVKPCLIIWWERFRGNQKEGDRGPLSIQFSLLHIKRLWNKITTWQIGLSNTLLSANSVLWSRRCRIHCHLAAPVFLASVRMGCWLVVDEL
jgi:hypothetical protein